MEAAASAQQALELFDNSFVRDFAFCTLHLGTARLLSGDVEEAARVIGEGTLLAARIRSVRLTNEVKAARARMEPWRETRAVRELDERLAGGGIEEVKFARLELQLDGDATACEKEIKVKHIKCALM
ncbi:MAG: hypothetical protein M3460_12235 [Actinomycetota bacterium]|nr:hypothetical protein [Actinomycetota bacterium]